MLIRYLRKVYPLKKELFKFQLNENTHLMGNVDDSGMAHLTCAYVNTKGVSVTLDISGSPKAALEELKAKIPGQIDDMIIDGLTAALGL